MAGVGESELRQRLIPESEPDYDPNLPYGGKVFLARRKKPDPLYVRVIEALVLICTLSFALYAYYYFDHLHFHVTYAYAWLGYPAANHQVGQRYLHGKGVEKHMEKAMEHFKKAADDGHPHASYNLAVGHLKGYKTGLRPGEAHKLIAHAASKGVKEAHNVLNEAETEETVKKILAHKGVQAVIIMNSEGIAIRASPGVDPAYVTHMVGLLHSTVQLARSLIKELDNSNELTFLRIRTKNHEIMVAPDCSTGGATTGKCRSWGYPPLTNFLPQEVDEVLKRINSHKGVSGVIVFNPDGIPIRTTLDNSTTVQYTSLVHQMSKKAKSVVRDLNPSDDLAFLRLRSKKHEIMIAPAPGHQDYTLVVVQHPPE
ncbi:hypothetical protein FSP39_002740 [Pinctada imbricata]|uniref:Roadblock/LAMTOR2 domain-containing protein n=1 Tax=Pinctada imbricata TaxID=66713 RepID=A0AA88XY30_PINIB|nr:hypothetical protein FSP39_002740 [Pinctada imbricata]